jgi:Ser-tRNA(Ala) deacylase AlaX
LTTELEPSSAFVTGAEIIRRIGVPEKIAREACFGIHVKGSTEVANYFE